MPGGVRWNPSHEPFSYWKLCYYYFPCLLFCFGLLVMVLSVFGKLEWLDRMIELLPSSTIWNIVIAVLLIAAYDFVFMKLLWKLLPSKLRQRIPYDAREANESKGDIRSVWDLRKLFAPSRRS